MALIQLPFVHRAQVIHKQCRRLVTEAYRATGYVQLCGIGKCDTTVAYDLELDAKNTVQLLEYDGRLFWPAAYNQPFRGPIIKNAFDDLLKGRLDLFSDQDLASSKPLTQDPSVRHVEASGMAAAEADLHRKVLRCLLIDGELYLEGGPPIYIASMAQLSALYWISSSGADRSLEPRLDGLALQPGGAHLREVQAELARGAFWLPSKHRDAGRTSYPIIRVRVEHELDPVDLRVDAECRLLWEDFNRGLFPAGDERGQMMFAILSAARRLDQPNLTAIRCEALHKLLAIFPERLKNTQRHIRDVLEFAAKAGRTVTGDEFRAQTAAVDEALAELAREMTA